MRALVQRVGWAEVVADGRNVGRIEAGLLVYVAVGVDDTRADAEWLAAKIADLRIFEDEEGKLNMSVRDARGGVLAVSNFTLLADARRGRRPAFADAAPAEQAEPIHEAFVAALRGQALNVATGLFGARMAIRCRADGPVNVVIDTPPNQ